MKVKLIAFIVTVMVIVASFTVNYSLHTIKYNGVKIKMPYIVNVKINKNNITVTRIPSDGTLLTFSSKDIDFNEYKTKVLSKSETSKIVENRIIDLNDRGKIQLVISSLANSQHITLIDGYIEKKRLLFTFSGNADSTKKFYSSLENIVYYE